MSLTTSLRIRINPCWISALDGSVIKLKDCGARCAPQSFSFERTLVSKVARLFASRVREHAREHDLRKALSKVGGMVYFINEVETMEIKLERLRQVPTYQKFVDELIEVLEKLNVIPRTNQ